jgi:RimJ/RimL family protein N-acetyltransferase
MTTTGASGYPSLHPLREELQGPRVVLRAYRLEDAPALWEAIAESRDHLRPWESFADDFRTLEETRDWIVRRSAAWLLRERCTWGLWQRQGGRYLGQVELWPRGAQGWTIPAFVLAYWIRASAQGHGYVSEGVRLLTAYAFEELGAQRVELGIDAKNVRSVAVARRCGFVQEGCLRHTGVEEDGTLVDNLIFALVPSDPR